VVAVGEVGYDSMTAEEDTAFARQLQLAVEHELPVLVHTPHRDKAAGTRRTLDVVRESGLSPSWVVVDHLNEVTVPLVIDSGCWMAFSIYPDTKMDPDRMVRILHEYGTDRMLVNSAADWGKSDPLRTKLTAEAMRASGFSEDEVEKVFWRNPVAFYGLSGRLDMSEIDSEPSALYQGNSVLRGARE
jgi:predicted metal-dependent TIM-barrel fold hydrolase